jgi:hypothetical protein
LSGPNSTRLGLDPAGKTEAHDARSQRPKEISSIQKGHESSFFQDFFLISIGIKGLSLDAIEAVSTAMN